MSFTFEVSHGDISLLNAVEYQNNEYILFTFEVSHEDIS